VTLTIDPKRVSREDAWLCGWGWVNEFKKALREYRSRRGQKWSFVGGVVEVMENGYPHWHLAFVGRWVAPKGVISRYWSWGHTNVKAVSAPARYLAKYISKANFGGMIEVGDWVVVRLSMAYLYAFGVRLHNLRHRRGGGKRKSGWLCLGLWRGRWNHDGSSFKLGDDGFVLFRRYRSFEDLKAEAGGFYWLDDGPLD